MTERARPRAEPEGRCPSAPQGRHSKDVLPKIKAVRVARPFVGFYLAGGTALALQIGHGVSVDFDLFCDDELDRSGALTGYSPWSCHSSTSALFVTDDEQHSFLNLFGAY
jgi:hypothetical protein